MKLLKKYSPSPAINAVDRPGRLASNKLSLPHISSNPREAAAQLNDDLLQSLILSLHFATHDQRESYKRFEGRIYIYESIIIMATPSDLLGKHYSNDLFRISAHTFAESSALPVYSWVKGIEFDQMPVAIGSARFQEQSLMDDVPSQYDFILVSLNPLLFNESGEYLNIELLESFVSAARAIPYLFSEEGRFSAGYPLLLKELRALLDASNSKHTTRVFWDRNWDLKSLLENRKQAN